MYLGFLPQVWRDSRMILSAHIAGMMGCKIFHVEDIKAD